MTTIEAVATVGPDHKLTLDVPEDVPTGRHRVVVLLDTEVADEQPESESQLEWEGNLLVFTGRGRGELDIVAEIARDRERRMIDVVFGTGE